MFKTKRGAAAAGAAAAALTVAALTQWEGMDRVAQHFSIDPPGVITVCYGMTNYDRPLKTGQEFTEDECKAFLLHDIPKYEAQAAKCIPGLYEMPAHRRAAINSFTYNVGGGALCKSSVAKYLNAGDIEKGCGALLLYTRANGKVLRGLERRRQFERSWCLRED